MFSFHLSVHVHDSFLSAKYINLIRFVAILVEMKSKLNHILITSFTSLEITSSSRCKSRFKILLARPRWRMHVHAVHDWFFSVFDHFWASYNSRQLFLRTFCFAERGCIFKNKSCPWRFQISRTQERIDGNQWSHNLKISRDEHARHSTLVDYNFLVPMS